jgi:hypothetical protein
LIKIDKKVAGKIVFLFARNPYLEYTGKDILRLGGDTQ